jgi:hypothetical protein
MYAVTSGDLLHFMPVDADGHFCYYTLALRRICQRLNTIERIAKWLSAQKESLRAWKNAKST